ncbi:MAG: phage Gp37/Gp68 family protein [Desulfobacterales bacterium]|nr:phage Gp37/Gp68 family protein [Desulfobacterales bacterium]
MSTKSTIEWTEQTWNPATGCTKVSPGCLNCYAEAIARRLAENQAQRLAQLSPNGFSLSSSNVTIMTYSFFQTVGRLGR